MAKEAGSIRVGRCAHRFCCWGLAKKEKKKEKELR